LGFVILFINATVTKTIEMLLIIKTKKMNYKKLSYCLLFLITTMSFAQNALWLRYPSISPDGKTIAFGYKGDIYLVPAQGGTATALTIHDAHDMMPVWSKDGKQIAFASDRYGNFDVFVMPISGGTPTRLSYNSASDFPYDFSPDSKNVLFGSGRQMSENNIHFYSPRLFHNLYSVSASGGKSILITEGGIEYAKYNKAGTQIVFQDRKGYEDALRKHHTSSVTRDIWVFDVNKKTYSKISNYVGEDREPVFSNDGQNIYYLSEADGRNQNVYKQGLQLKTATPLTTFTNNPVRHLSISQDNKMCFSHDGEIYTMIEGNKPQKITVSIQNDGKANVEKNVPLTGNVSEFVPSPNGKEIAFISRGEVFVSNTEGGTTKRITNTPEQERYVQWSPDNKTLIYASEREQSWDIYTAKVERKEEAYFYSSTLIKEEKLIESGKEEFMPKYSPDGKEIAFIEERNIVRIYNIASKNSRTVLPEGRNYSYSDGDFGFNWSNDSKWLFIDDNMGNFGITHTAMIKADGSETKYPIMSGFGEDSAKQQINGKAIAWLSSKDGRKSLANQGSRELDVYAVFFDKKDYESFKLSKEDTALLKENEDKDKKDKEAENKNADKDKTDKVAKKEEVKIWNPDLTNIETRKVRVTINSSSIADFVFNDDGTKLFYLSAFEKGYDLWVTETKTKETKILAKLGGSPSTLYLSKDNKTLFVNNAGKLSKVDTESGKITGIDISSEMILNTQAERNYIFNHMWRQTAKKFYDPKLHGVDWKMYKETYAKFLPHINNNYDFQELLSEILGELNGSHTGGRFSPAPVNADVTASLGLLYDEKNTGDNLKVTEVILGGPIDKANSKLKAGSIITKIDNENITSTVDWAKFLNKKIGKLTLISGFDANGVAFQEAVKPISFAEESGLMYNRWIKKMNHMTEKLSNGKVGYVHVQGMNDGSFREVFDQVMGKNFEKKALIVDTRFNGGGWLHDDLNTFLSGKRYLDFAPQGNRLKDAEPLGKWTKPSCVIMCEGNYSDAFIFPYIYKQNGIGKLIGTGVPGTGTAVWWETQIDPTMVFGIPMVATIGKENRPTENLQVEPDFPVELKYEDYLNGTDKQLEKAVQEMLKSIKE
jgi:tricorn protease